MHWVDHVLQEGGCLFVLHGVCGWNAVRPKHRIGLKRIFLRSDSDRLQRVISLVDARVGVKASDEAWWWSDEVEVERSWWLKHLQIHSRCHPIPEKVSERKRSELCSLRLWSLANLHPLFFSLGTCNSDYQKECLIAYIDLYWVVFWRQSPTSLVSLIDIDTFQFHTSGRTLGTALGAWTSTDGGPHKGRSKKHGKMNLLHPVHPLKLNMKLSFKMGKRRYRKLKSSSMLNSGV